jgi:hypothetical protein
MKLQAIKEDRYELVGNKFVITSFAICIPRQTLREKIKEDEIGGNIAHIGGKKYACKVLVGKHKGNGRFTRPV